MSMSYQEQTGHKPVVGREEEGSVSTGTLFGAQVLSKWAFFTRCGVFDAELSAFFLPEDPSEFILLLFTFPLMHIQKMHCRNCMMSLAATCPVLP